MTNIINVIEHIKKKLVEECGRYDRCILSFLKPEDGKPCYYTGSSKYSYRVYGYVAV